MKIALVHNHYSEQHLAEVIEQMRNLGAPRIKAVWMECYDMWAAIEGCHRIRAAKALGLTPVIDEIEYDEDRDLADPKLGLDLDNPGSTLGWLVDDCYRRTIIEF